MEGIIFSQSIMPQLDKLTYFTQFFWSCLFFLTFYMTICNDGDGVLGISRILKLLMGLHRVKQKNKKPRRPTEEPVRRLRKWIRSLIDQLLQVKWRRLDRTDRKKVIREILRDMELDTETDVSVLHEWGESIRRDPKLLKQAIRDVLEKLEL